MLELSDVTDPAGHITSEGLKERGVPGALGLSWTGLLLFLGV